jgi:hypothetical protein
VGGSRPDNADAGEDVPLHDLVRPADLLGVVEEATSGPTERRFPVDAQSTPTTPPVRTAKTIHRRTKNATAVAVVNSMAPVY